MFKWAESDEGGTTPSESAVIRFLDRKPRPTDDEFHAWAESKGYNKHKAEQVAYKILSDIVNTGRSKGKMPPGTPSKEIRQGIKVEKEHTPNRDIARKVVADHIKETGPGYYPALLKMEKNLEKKALDDGAGAAHPHSNLPKRRKVKPTGALRSKLGPMKKDAGIGRVAGRAKVRWDRMQERLKKDRGGSGKIHDAIKKLDKEHGQGGKRAALIKTGTFMAAFVDELLKIASIYDQAPASAFKTHRGGESSREVEKGLATKGVKMPRSKPPSVLTRAIHAARRLTRSGRAKLRQPAIAKMRQQTKEKIEERNALRRLKVKKQPRDMADAPPPKRFGRVFTPKKEPSPKSELRQVTTGVMRQLPSDARRYVEILKKEHLTPPSGSVRTGKNRTLSGGEGETMALTALKKKGGFVYGLFDEGETITDDIGKDLNMKKKGSMNPFMFGFIDELEKLGFDDPSISKSLKGDPDSGGLRSSLPKAIRAVRRKHGPAAARTMYAGTRGMFARGSRVDRRSAKVTAESGADPAQALEGEKGRRRMESATLRPMKRQAAKEKARGQHVSAGFMGKSKRILKRSLGSEKTSSLILGFMDEALGLEKDASVIGRLKYLMKRVAAPVRRAQAEAKGSKAMDKGNLRKAMRYGGVSAGLGPSFGREPKKAKKLVKSLEAATAKA